MINQVSVVIPVFNAECYILKAVQSALKQPEVGEIILVEDASKDGSLALCEELKKKFNRVKLYQHPGGKNRGAGISRNLGIEMAQSEYISFLDADDYYLADRFASALGLLSQDKSVDGVYQTIGCEYCPDYCDGRTKKRHLERMRHKKKNIANPKLAIDWTGVESEIAPRDLFLSLMKCNSGWIHLNGLTLRRTALQKIDWFNGNFLGQDSEFIARLAFERKLVGIEPRKEVAVRTVHAGNRVLFSTDTVGFKTNQISIENSYWLTYAICNGASAESVRYLLLRSTDDKCQLKKIFKIIRVLVGTPNAFARCLF